MNLQDKKITYAKLCAASVLTVATIPAYASVTYNFTSAPFNVGVELNTFGNIVTTNPTPIAAGSPQTASLTFASALAANTTTVLSAESGGYDFIGAATQGGLVAYAANNFFPWAITSDINEYVVGSAGSILQLAHYSGLTGSVTTDATGNIASWDLTFTLYDAPGSGFQLDTNLNTIDIPPGTIDALLHITSAPAGLVTITNVVALNGVANNNDYTFTGTETVFLDPGNAQYKYYTQQPGSFSTVNAIPAPSTLMLIVGASLFGLPWRRVRRGS